MNRAWKNESRRYKEKMYKAYNLNEAFDKVSFNNDPIGYFGSINYDLKGIDWVPAVWNLLRLAKTDSNILKGQLGPNGKKVKTIVLKLLNRNPDLKSKVENTEQKLPQIMNKYGNSLERSLLTEREIVNYERMLESDRLNESLSKKVKTAILLVLLAVLATTGLSAQSKYDAFKGLSDAHSEEVVQIIHDSTKDEKEVAIQTAEKIVKVIQHADYDGGGDDPATSFLQALLRNGVIHNNDILKLRSSDLSDAQDVRDTIRDLAIDLITCAKVKGRSIKDVAKGVNSTISHLGLEALAAESNIKTSSNASNITPNNLDATKLRNAIENASTTVTMNSTNLVHLTNLVKNAALVCYGRGQVSPSSEAKNLGEDVCRNIMEILGIQSLNLSQDTNIMQVATSRLNQAYDTFGMQNVLNAFAEYLAP